MLAAEPKIEKNKQDVFSQKMMELNHHVQIERDLRTKAEAKAGEVVDIADELVKMHNIPYEPSVTVQLLDAGHKTKVEDLDQEILKLSQILHKEK